MYGQSILYDYAMSFNGTPYRWGGDDPMGGLDCSGLCLELLQSAGIIPGNIDLNAQGIYTRLTIDGCPVNPEADFGALAFFGKDATAISHVGFCLNQYEMIEAGGGGSKTKHIKDAMRDNAYVRVRPITNRSDRVAFVKPKYRWKSDG